LTLPAQPFGDSGAGLGKRQSSLFTPPPETPQTVLRCFVPSLSTAPTNSNLSDLNLVELVFITPLNYSTQSRPSVSSAIQKCASQPSFFVFSVSFGSELPRFPI
jgi:hypothetical protein